MIISEEVVGALEISRISVGHFFDVGGEISSSDPLTLSIADEMFEFHLVGGFNCLAHCVAAETVGLSAKKLVAHAALVRFFFDSIVEFRDTSFALSGFRGSVE